LPPPPWKKVCGRPWPGSYLNSLTKTNLFFQFIFYTSFILYNPSFNIYKCCELYHRQSNFTLFCSLKFEHFVITTFIFQFLSSNKDRTKYLSKPNFFTVYRDSSDFNLRTSPSFQKFGLSMDFIQASFVFTRSCTSVESSSPGLVHHLWSRSVKLRQFE
jgi:hypothetical protein